MKDILVLGLGNPAYGDDGVGIEVVRALKKKDLPGVAMVETSESGLALLNYFIGYEKAMIVDAIQTERHPRGTILSLRLEELGKVAAPTPHYAGLPELIALAKRLNLPFPEDYDILGIEIGKTPPFGSSLTSTIKRLIPIILRKIERRLNIWGVKVIA